MRTANLMRAMVVALLAWSACTMVDVQPSVADVTPIRGGRGRSRPMPPRIEDEGVLSALVLTNKPGAEEATLILPGSLVRSLADAGRTNDMSDARSHRTMIAGAALSMSIASLVFVRRGRPGTRWIASGMLVVSLASIVAAYAMADIPAPPRRDPEGVALRVIVEDDADSVQLILNDQRIKLPR